MAPVVLALVALAAGCSVKRVPLQDPATTARPAPYDFQGEAKSPPPPDVQPAPASAGQEPPPTLDTPNTADLDQPPVQVQDLPASPPPPTATTPAAGPATPATSAPGTPGSIAGYRVQIFASADRAAAERVRGDAESKVGSKAYLLYQAPYYKVRVGNCRTSDSCTDLQGRLRAAGFETVWIVPDQVEP